uniref:Uncharacterized protein n=1 Tax=Arundo donax TaxID=35708 RepID=A0A0A9HJ82_ARUDO
MRSIDLSASTITGCRRRRESSVRARASVNRNEWFWRCLPGTGEDAFDFTFPETKLKGRGGRGRGREGVPSGGGGA